MQDQTTHERAAQPTGCERLETNGHAGKLARPPVGQLTGVAGGLPRSWAERVPVHSQLQEVEWRDGRRVLCLAPAFRAGTPEYFRRVAGKCEAAGDVGNAKSFRFMATDIERKSEERVLGKDVYSAIYAARQLAAMLRSRRPLPRGASAVHAQLSLLDWLPAMRRGERADVLEILRGCSAKRLGRQLGEMVAELSAK